MIDLRKVNRSEVARKTGYDVTTISRILSGDRKPSLDSAIMISDFLDVTLEEFLECLPRKE